MEVNESNPYREVATAYLCARLLEGGVPIPSVSGIEVNGVIPTAHDYERDDFNAYEVELTLTDAHYDDGRTERFYFAVVAINETLPRVVLDNFEPVYVCDAGKDFSVYACKRFKRPKSNLFLLSLDLETGDYAGPKLGDNSTVIQGHEVAPILQLAGILSDRSGKELMRFDYMLDSKLMAGLNPETLAFHRKTGFWSRWEEADRISLESAIENILSDMGKAIGQLTHYHYHARNHIVLLGKSIWFDRTFLMAQAPELVMYLSHQMIDVSVIKPILKEVNPNIKGLSSTRSTHLALDDCESAIAEYKALRGIVSLLPNEDDYADTILEDYLGLSL